MRKKLIIIFLIGIILIIVNISAPGFTISNEKISDNEISNENNISFCTIYHADAGKIYSGISNEKIIFDGSGSYISGTASYEWDFADPFDQTHTIGYGKSVSHKYSIPGEYIVTLTVKNNVGDVYKDVAPVFINKPGNHLIPDGRCFYTAKINEMIEFDASNSISNGAEIVEYFWNFGDGATDYGKVVTHSYNTERVYLVTLQVTDGNGVKRYDVLHADIGMSFSDDSDCYANSGTSPILQQIFNYLINSQDVTTSIFSNLFDAKIYTNYNGVEKFTSLKGANYPLSIDVTGNSINDIKINGLKFFKTVKTNSLFDDNSRVWNQFETTLSSVQKISSEIQTADDFTLCLQLDFSLMASYLGLDDTIMRIGYHSEDGQVKPDSVTVTHILRPYLLFRLLGMNYWPEYGLRIDQNSGDSFSLFVSLSNSDGSSKTILQSTFNQGTTFMYKRTKIGGVWNHASILEIPGNSDALNLSIVRIKSGIVTSLSTKFTFSSSLKRGIEWSDTGLSLGILGKTQVSLYEFYFDNPEFTFTLGEISFVSSGSINLTFDKTNGKLELNGFNTGFTLKNLLFDSKKTDLEAEIQGTLNLNSGSSILIGFAKGELDIGFEGQITLYSDCLFRINQDSIKVAGDFSLESDGDIAFMWGNDEFIVDLTGGVSLAITNLNIEIKNLTLHALFLDISTDGEFGVKWDTVTSLVTVSGGTGASMSITDLGFVYNGDAVDLTVNVYGSLDVDAGGWVTFGAGTFKAGFTGELDLGSGGAYCKFEVNGKNIKIGGVFDLEGNDGEIVFTWTDNEFSLDVVGNSALTVDDLYFEITLATGKIFKVFTGYVGVGLGGEFGISWDTANNEVTVFSGGSVSLSLTDLEINYGTTLTIKILGTMEIQGGGSLIFGPNTFSASFTGSLNLGMGGDYVTFVINGDNIQVGGLFSLIGGGGEITIEWTSGELCLSVSGSPNLQVTDFYFGATISGKVIQIGAGKIEVGANGDITINWNTATNEMTITSDVGVLIGVEDFSFNFNYGTLSVQIIGFLEIQANGYVTFAPGIFEAGFTGSLNLGGGVFLGNYILQSPSGGTAPQNYNDGYCEFIINGENLKVGGLFSLSVGPGEITFTWDTDEFNLYVSSDVTLGVQDLYFEAQLLKVEVEGVSIGADGDLSLDWNTVSKTITLSSDFNVLFSVTNFNFSYNDPTLVVVIDGTLNIQVNGYVTLGVGTFNAGFTGILDLGTNGNYCQFTVNTVILKIGGKYQLTTGNILFTWSSSSFTLSVSGGTSLSVDDLYFESGSLKVTADSTGVGVNGELNLDWTSTTVTISSNGVVGLSIGYLNVTYGSTLDIKIIGLLEIEGSGWFTFGSGVFEAGFSGTFDLGAQCAFEVNGNSITIGGVFTLSSGNGEISFEWTNGLFSLSVSGGPQLSVTNLYFNAEISSQVLEISADQLSIGANGDLSVEWDTTNDEITIYSDAGVQISVENIDVSYGNSFDFSILGTLYIQADGYISLNPNAFEASFSGSLILSSDFGFVINGATIHLSGIFNLGTGEGAITISWNSNQLMVDFSGALTLNVDDFYFEGSTLKAQVNKITIANNGDLTFTKDNTNKKFEVTGSATFGTDLISIYYKDGSSWLSILSATNFDITGGGYLLLQGGTTPKIYIDMNAGIELGGLAVTPPSSWNNIHLTVSEAGIAGDVTIELEKESGLGKFKIVGPATGSISGDITSLHAHFTVDSNNLEFNIGWTDFKDDFIVSASTSPKSVSFNSNGYFTVYDLNVKYSTGIDLTVDMVFQGLGNIIALWTENTFVVDADVNFEWDISVDTASYGDWEIDGSINGDGVVTADWQNKNIKLDIHEQGSLEFLNVVHDPFTLNLADISLTPGIITFSWYRDDATQTGYLLLDSDITQSICTLNLVKVTWGTKSVSFGWPDIVIGECKFAWDIPNRYITLNNGISNLGPTLKYEDTSQSLEISGSIGSLQSDYSKTILLKWFELNGEISGIQIDTANSHLAELLQFKVIKGTTGKKLVIYGLHCNNFYIMKDSSNNLKFGGQIFIANHLVYSKLVSGSWKDFDIQWNFQSTPRFIKFTKDPDYDFTLKLISVYILNFQFTATIDFLTTDYCEVKWTIGTSGIVYIDTNWNYLSTITFQMWYNNEIGMDITASALRAENWWVSWTVWPPQEAYVQSGGSLQIGSINIDVYYNSQWKHLWPW